MTTTTIMDDEPSESREISDRLSVDMLCVQAGNDEASSSAEATTRLLVWLSPAFPVGSFAFSHGLEWAVHAGRIHDAASTIVWLETLLEHGALRNDAVFATCAWQAAVVGDMKRLREVNELALATSGSRERYLETTAQGNAFVAIVRKAWLTPTLERLFQSLRGDAAYPIAVATASAAHDVALDDMLRFYASALIQNLVSATIRLSVIGHTDGQRVIATLLPSVANLARAAASATLDDIGGAAFQSDIASMRHETQYSRLFRS